jgi:hypothetical protein
MTIGSAGGAGPAFEADRRVEKALDAVESERSRIADRVDDALDARR